MSKLNPTLKDVIAAGPMFHLATLNADGSPQVTVIWAELDGEDLISGHMSYHVKLKNMERDPRVVLSFEAPREPGVFLAKYAVLHCNATVTQSDETWPLLNRLAKLYMAPDSEFPAPQGPGWITRYKIERVGGVGPWVS